MGLFQENGQHRGNQGHPKETTTLFIRLLTRKQRPIVITARLPLERLVIQADELNGPRGHGLIKTTVVIYCLISPLMEVLLFVCNTAL